jgi:hypothetical protein
LNTEKKALAFKRTQTDSSAIVAKKLMTKDAVKLFKLPQAWRWYGVKMCGVSLQSVRLKWWPDFNTSM